jgi:hypothetical protein
VVCRAKRISNAIGYAKFFNRSHDGVIRVYDEAGNVIETHEQSDDFKELCANPVWLFRAKQKTATQ